MLTSSLVSKFRMAAVVLLAVLGANMVAATGNAHAASLADIYLACERWGNIPMDQMSPAAATLTLSDCINDQRRAQHVRSLNVNLQLGRAAAKHAKESIATPFWDKNRGHVSHLNPTTPIPPDQQTLDQLANRDAFGRVQASGYGAGCRNYSAGEITYGGAGTGATSNAAVAWWMSDQEHREALLNTKWKDFGAVGYRGSAFNPPDTGSTGTFVVEFGVCTK